MAHLEFRRRNFDAHGCLPLLRLLSDWRHARDAAWAAAGHPCRSPESSFWALPGDGRAPTPASVHQWYRHAAHIIRGVDVADLTHHSLRKGGTTSAFSLGVGIWSIADWGGWSLKSDAIQRYIAMAHRATASDFKFFGWMRSGPERLQSSLGHLFE